MHTEAKSTRLFENNFLERLTHVHHNTPLFIYIPILLASLFYAAQLLTISFLIVGFVLGLFLWTFFEYVLHRFVFHYEPKSDWGKRVHYLFHGIHHDFPNEKDRLVMPPVTSLPLSALFFTFYYLIFGPASFPLFAGFILGYLYYEFVHYSVHHKKRPDLTWSEGQRRNHLTHHFKDADHRFGVTSPLWDYVFGTDS